MSEEEGEKLARVWDVGVWLRANRAVGLLKKAWSMQKDCIEWIDENTAPDVKGTRRAPHLRAKLMSLMIAILPVSATAQTGIVEVAAAATVAGLVSSLLLGINKALNDDARVDAQTISSGPDDDDLKFAADSDIANTPLEYHLHAKANAFLGPNPPWPHRGHAEMEIEWEDGGWLLKKRIAFSFPHLDSTPEKGRDNKTAVGSVATFGWEGSVVKEYTVKAEVQVTTPASKLTTPQERAPTGASHATGQGALRTNVQQDLDVELAMAPGEEDITVTAAASVVWTQNSFQIFEVGDSALVIPPVAHLDFVHSFIQGVGSSRFRSPFLKGLNPLLDQRVNSINTEVDRFLGTQPTNDTPVDFTLAGISAEFPTGKVHRNGLSEREVVERYLVSHHVQFHPPMSAQPGYKLQVSRFGLVGGGKDFPPESVFGQDGGYSEELNLSLMVGFFVESEGSLLEAMNLAANTPGNLLADFVSGLSIGETFSSNLKIGGSNQAFEASSRNAELVEGTAVLESAQHVAPEQFHLAHNYPNPFNGNTTLAFELPVATEVELSLYNVSGQKVTTLRMGHHEAGIYELDWDGRDDDGNELPSGTYLYELTTGARSVLAHKLLLLK